MQNILSSGISGSFVVAEYFDKVGEVFDDVFVIDLFVVVFVLVDIDGAVAVVVFDFVEVFVVFVFEFVVVVFEYLH